MTGTRCVRALSNQLIEPRIAFVFYDLQFHWKTKTLRKPPMHTKATNIAPKIAAIYDEPLTRQPNCWNESIEQRSNCVPDYMGATHHHTHLIAPNYSVQILFGPTNKNDIEKNRSEKCSATTPARSIQAYGSGFSHKCRRQYNVKLFMDLYRSASVKNWMLRLCFPWHTGFIALSWEFADTTEICC